MGASVSIIHTVVSCIPCPQLLSLECQYVCVRNPLEQEERDIVHDVNIHKHHC